MGTPEDAIGSMARAWCALPDNDAAGRVFGQIFALEQIRQDLADLADRIGEIAWDA